MQTTTRTIWLGLTAILYTGGCAGDPAVYDDESGGETADETDSGTDGETGDGTEEGSDATCGDGIHDAGEECDDGEANAAGATCTPACTKNVCGDGFALADIEACDDGNLEDADGCEADCSLPACENGIVDPGEVCYDEPTIHDLGVYYAVLETGDLDADGSADLVLLDNADDGIGVLLGTGDGNFVGKPSLVAPEESNALALVDIDGDQALDIIGVSGRGYCFMLPCDTVPGTVAWWLGDGDGGFGDPSSVEVGDTNLVVATADLDADGRPDVIVGDQTAKAVHVLMGNGTAPWFGDPASFPVEVPASGTAVGDLDGDDAPDLVVVGGPGLQILPGDGGGGFGSGQSKSLGTGLVDPWVVDIDADADLDILVADKSGTVVYVLLNDGDGGFGHAEEAWAGWAPNHMVVADLSQDGSLDFAAANTQPNLVTVGHGLGDGSFEEVPAFEPWGGPLDVVAADFDQDGAMDLAITRPGDSSVSLLLASP